MSDTPLERDAEWHPDVVPDGRGGQLVGRRLSWVSLGVDADGMEWWAHHPEGLSAPETELIFKATLR